MPSAVFRPSGLVAIEPQAFGCMFVMPEPPKAYMQGDVGIVPVRGPLESHAHEVFDSYEAIKARVDEVLALGARAVVLSIDSPGGLVAGCFETAHELRAKTVDVGIKLYAHVAGTAASAAYALACAAETIVAPASSQVGSIGVLAEAQDSTALRESMGLKTVLVKSGARKGDLHPGAPVSDDAIAALQERVDKMAAVFFGAVAERRPTLTPEAVAGFEGSVFLGADAKANGLADVVGGLNEALAMIAGGDDAAPAASATGEGTMPISEAREALKKVAESDNEEEAKKAKAALAALDKDDDEGEGEGRAEGDPPKKDDEEEGKAKGQGAAPAAAAPSATAPAVDVEARIDARFKAIAEDNERRELIASRPDFSDATKAMLAKGDIGMVREYVKSEPRRAPQNPAATAAVPGTPAKGQGGHQAPNLPTPESQALKERMGLATPSAGPRMEGNRLMLPAMTRQQARGLLAKREKEQEQASR